MDIHQLPDLSDWRYVEVWTLEEAAMLWAAIDPIEHDGARLGKLKGKLPAAQYKKALLFLRAVSEAVCAGTLPCAEAWEEDYDDANGAWCRKVDHPGLPNPTQIAAHLTRVRQAVFMKWAESKNMLSYRQIITQAKKMPLLVAADAELPPAQPTTLLLPMLACLDPSNPLSPIELRAGAEAWEIVISTGAHEGTKSPKKAIRHVLDTHPEYSQLSNEARSRISTVANWDREGGPPKTPTKANLPTQKE